MIVLVGLSHRTAPIEKREQLAVSDEAVEGMLRDLLSGDGVGEAMVLSTCNRVEVIAAAAAGTNFDMDRLLHHTASVLSQRHPEMDDYLYRYAGGDAVRHIFRVASSLDSMVVGEPQILGQLKAAYERARDQGALGPRLTRTLTHAIRTAKRVRTSTHLGEGQVSVPSVAVELARQIFGTLERKVVALVGSGDMGETVAEILKAEGAQTIVVGRNPDRVTALAHRMNGEGRSMDQLARTLSEADVVVTTTAAPHPIIDRAIVQRALKQRKGRSLFLIDLAVPRDVAADVGKLDNVYLYNVDDFSELVNRSLSSRQQEAQRAEEIVLVEADTFDRLSNMEQVTPVVVALRQRLRSVLDAELDRSLSGKLKHLSQQDREALSKMLESGLNKMLHAPTAKLKELATDSEDGGEALETAMMVLDELFDLGLQTPDEVVAEPGQAGLEGELHAVSGANSLPPSPKPEVS